MGVWADEGAAVADLRRFLNDGPTDRPVKGKPVVGRIDGINTDFITWDDRLVDGTLRVMDNNLFLPDTAVALVDPILGEFTITPAPATNHTILGVYYFQFFLDTEMVEALQMATESIASSDDITSVPVGFRPAALAFASSWAYEKQSMRWTQRLSNRFRVEDEPVDKDVAMRPKLFKEWADDFWDKGVKFRDDVYTRQGRRNVPAIARTSPFLPPVAPRR